MCRLLAVVRTTPAPLASSLADVLPLFTVLSELHHDGWGVAAVVGDQVRVRKRPERASLDGEYGAAVRETETDAAVLHLRWATEGMAPRQGNTHPFSLDGVAFAHNGSAEPVDQIWGLVDDDLKAHPEGDTDSEAYFRAVVSAMRRADPATALAGTARALRDRCAVSGLNAMLLTREALFVYSDHDPDSPPSLRHGTDYFPIRYRREPDQVLVSSTGFEQPEPAWALLPERHVLTVRRHTLETTITRF